MLEAKEEFDANGYFLSSAQCMKSMADILYAQERYDEAISTIQEVKLIFEEIGHPLGAAECIRHLGHIAASQGRIAEADQFLNDVRKRCEAIGQHRGVEYCDEALEGLHPAPSSDQTPPMQEKPRETALTRIGRRFGGWRTRH
ncbi:hypothetical protein CALCODRAFT_501721 [Calocera cornea HHB12733]|uniref:TPR-like protein n=1 Tax=Calocera cornea HHB12733 TaxID=1353952 RepID=A0A165DIM6_9BASI|nr:hypothetical protein CALCODRAFT_501721 [Calocera cornea HHB12733]